MLCMRPFDALDLHLHSGPQPDMNDWIPLKRSNSLSCSRVLLEDLSKSIESARSHCEKNDFSVRRCTTLNTYNIALSELETISSSDSPRGSDLSAAEMSRYFGEFTEAILESKGTPNYTIPSPVRVTDFPLCDSRSLAESPLAEWSDSNLPETPKQEAISNASTRRSDTLQTPKLKTLADRLVAEITDSPCYGSESQEVSATSLKAALHHASRLGTFKSQKQTSLLRFSSI